MKRMGGVTKLVLIDVAITMLLASAKLTGAIDWSWFWLLSPIWGAAAICLVLLVMALCAFFWAGEPDKNVDIIK